MTDAPTGEGRECRNEDGLCLTHTDAEGRHGWFERCNLASPGASVQAVARLRRAMFAYRARAYQYSPEMPTDLDKEYEDVLESEAASPLPTAIGTNPTSGNAGEMSRGMAVALLCTHGRWVGEAQFAACVPCIDRALGEVAAQEEREVFEGDVKMLDEMLRAIGAKDGSCVLSGLERIVKLARIALQPPRGRDEVTG